MAETRHNGSVVVRDLIIFQIKLLLDGLKDIVVSQISIAAAALDLLFPTGRRGARFYAVMRTAERFDNWLSLYGATESAGECEEGLFGASRAGSDTLLGKLEQLVLGRKEAEADQAGAYSRKAA